MKRAKFTIKLFNGLNKYNFEGEQWSERITRIDGKKAGSNFTIADSMAKANPILSRYQNIDSYEYTRMFREYVKSVSQRRKGELRYDD